MSADVTAALLAAAKGAAPITGPSGAYHLPDWPADLERHVVDRFVAANELWWQMEITAWDLMVKHYRAGDRHPPHQDLHATAATRKIAGTVQLSESTATTATTSSCTSPTIGS